MTQPCTRISTYNLVTKPSLLSASSTNDVAETSVTITQHALVLFHTVVCNIRTAGPDTFGWLLRVPPQKIWVCPRWIILLLYATLRLPAMIIPVISCKPHTTASLKPICNVNVPPENAIISV